MGVIRSHRRHCGDRFAYRVGTTLAVCFSVLVTGCIGNTGSEQPATGASGSATSSSGGGSKSSSSGFVPGSSASGAPSGGGSFITISKVVRSNINPDGIIELIGTNGDIGNNCPAGQQGACRCVFRWTEPTGFIRETEVDLIRAESNLARCSFESVSADAKHFDVTLKIMAANLTSNTVRVFMPTANPSLDTSLSSNYLPVMRYMCRDIWKVGQNTNMYKRSLLDPQLWDKSLAYNFYTTTLGLDYGATPSPGVPAVGNQALTFECPPIPNDPSENALYDYRIFSLAEIDLDNPTSTTVAPGTGDNTIFPNDDNLRQETTKCPTGAEAECEKFMANRHDFYLATFKSGVFKEPLCVLHKVTNKLGPLNCTLADTSTGTVTLESLASKSRATNTPQDAIGFAAVPDQNQRCPDPNVTKIPPGKKWAKLWRFRFSHDKRKATELANDSQIGDLFCTTRNEECGSNKPGYVPGSSDTPPAVVPPMRIVNTVCYNAKPTAEGPKLGFAVMPTFGGKITDRGMGNCDPGGNAGDGNGPGMWDADDVDPVNNPPTAELPGFDQGCYPFDDATAQCPQTESPCAFDPTTGDELSFNCCLDLGYANGAAYDPNRRPANFAQNGGSICNPALIGRNNASSQNVPHVAIGGDLAQGPHEAGGYDLFGNGTLVQGVAEDVWLIGKGDVQFACIEADTDPNGRLASIFSDIQTARPNPFSFTQKFLDGGSQEDVILVVTPENVTVEQMMDLNSPIAQMYTPFRFPDGSDASQRQVYALDVESHSTPNPGQRLSRYPLCVLQDAKKGQIESTP